MKRKRRLDYTLSMGTWMTNSQTSLVFSMNHSVVTLRRHSNGRLHQVSSHLALSLEVGYAPLHPLVLQLTNASCTSLTA